MIDTTFDFRSDAGGKDPDSHSPTLRRYHRVLWSKPLPSGHVFELSDQTRGSYLHHRSEIGEFFLSSDAVMATFARWMSMKPIMERFNADEVEEFDRLGYTIGGLIIWPGNKVDGKMTINGARGFSRSIADRMDLTLECVRRYYAGRDSPLGPTLARYAAFFRLFETFKGYVDFFLLNDLVSPDYKRVSFFMPFDDFRPPAVPRDHETYVEFRRRSMDFIRARNLRIDAWAARCPSGGSAGQT